MKNFTCLILVFLFLTITITSSVAQTTITFDDQGWTDEQIIGASVTLSDYIFRAEEAGVSIDLKVDNGNSYSGLALVANGVNFTPNDELIITKTGSASFKFVSFHYSGAAFVGKLTVTPYNSGVPGTAQTNSSPGSSGVFTLNSSFENIDEVRISGGSTYGLVANLDQFIFEPVVASSTPGLWTGATSTDWNTASNWDDNQVPSGIAVTLPTGLTNYPILTTDLVYSGDITIESGASLTVNAGVDLNEAGTLTNNAGNTGLVLKADASSRAQLMLPSGHADVAATVEHFFPEETLLGFGFGAHGINKDNVSLTDGNYWWVKQFNENVAAGTNYADSWEFLDADLNPAIDALSGYIGYFNHPTLTDGKTVSVTGNISSAATTTYTLTYNDGMGNGWNLLANPYPTYINTEDLSGMPTNWTPGNIDNSIHIYGGGNWQSSLLDQDQPSVAPGEAFFVKANAGTPTLQLGAGARTLTPAPTKKANIQRVKISVVYEKYSDRTVVYANTNATAGYDGGELEVQKMFGLAEAPQLYTRTDGQYLSYNALPEFTEATAQPFELITPANGTYTIILMKDNLHEFAGICVRDMKTGEIHEGNQFTIEGVEGETRQFTLLFSKKALAVGKLQQHDIRTVDNRLRIQLTEAGDANVAVYDIMGKHVKSERFSGSLKFIDLQAGAYIVKLHTSLGQQVERVVLR